MSTQHHEDPHRQASAALVVGVDGSEGSDLAVRWAAEVAARRGRGLLIVHGLDLATMRSTFSSYDVMIPAVTDAIRHRGQEILDTARRLAHEVDPGLTVNIELSEAQPADLLIRRSKSAYQVAIGATGNAGTLAHLGSTLLAVTSHGHGAVVVVRDTGSEQQTRHTGPVVVGVDGSPVSDAAIAAAFAEASERNAALIAVHSWSERHFGEFAGLPNGGILRPDIETAEDAILAERIAGWQEKYPDVQVTRKVYLSSPVKQLTEWSKSAQLIVLGTRGRGGFTGLLLGSTSNFLVQHAHCPVMVVHQD